VRDNESGGDLGTTTGSVKVLLDPSVNLNLDTSATGGSFSSDIPVRVRGKVSRSSLTGTIGKGGEQPRIRSGDGSIRISRLQWGHSAFSFRGCGFSGEAGHRDSTDDSERVTRLDGQGLGEEISGDPSSEAVHARRE